MTGLGTSKITLEGTVKWSWEDNNGIRHNILINNLQYYTDLPLYLLSPQHLAQSTKDITSTGVTILGNQIKFFWANSQHCQTTQLIKEDGNIGFVRLSPGFKLSSKAIFMFATRLPNKPAHFCYPTHWIPPDNDKSSIGSDTSGTPREPTTQYQGGGRNPTATTTLSLTKLHSAKAECGHAFFNQKPSTRHQPISPLRYHWTSRTK